MACRRRRTRERDREREHGIEREIGLQHAQEKKNSEAGDIVGELMMLDLDGA